MSDIKLVNYGELDCKLSDYLATDGVVMETAISLSDMVDDILKLVNECSYPDTKIQTLQKENAEKDEIIARLRECLDKMEKHLMLPHQVETRDKLHGEIHRALTVKRETLKELEGGE